MYNAMPYDYEEEITRAEGGDISVFDEILTALFFAAFCFFVLACGWCRVQLRRIKTQK